MTGIGVCAAAGRVRARVRRRVFIGGSVMEIVRRPTLRDDDAVAKDGAPGEWFEGC